MKPVYVAHVYTTRYHRFMRYVTDYLDHPQKDTIEHRLRILDFYEEFRLKATTKAFGVSRSTVYLWKKKLSDNKGKLSSLAPGSKTPLHKRKRVVNPLISDFILKYRAKYPGADKTTITPALIGECHKRDIKPPSESTVGRIIHDLKEAGKLPRQVRVFLNGETGKLRYQEKRLVRKKPRRKGFSPSRPGELVQIDTVDVFVDGLKRYLLTAIDLSSRFAFAYTYKSSSSAAAKDFLTKLRYAAPFEIKRVQTDNGHEFLKHFEQSCRDEGLTHYFNYPHHPQSNGHLERFNRTIQEQFTSLNTDWLDDTDVFNRRLMDYLLYYNTERPHRGIGKVSPLRYYVDNFINPQKSNMLWTLT